MLKELFAKNNKIIINTDIDGFLSGMILQKYYGCKVVGFSNSRETIWVSPEVKSIYAPIYIDLYVNRPDVVCIEQHIISYNRDHHYEISGFGTKINPNLERKRTFVGDMDSDYYHKYPFGTVHFLISLMAKEGIHVELSNLKENIFIPDIKKSVCAGHVLLRADDALYSTLSPYRDNALDWWKWLDTNNTNPAIKQIMDFINSCSIYKAKEYKQEIGTFFTSLGCDGLDGAFKTITDQYGILLTKVKRYCDIICSVMNMKLNIPEQYIIHKGKYEVSFCRPGYDMTILKAPNLYSYAFIFGPRPKYPNFSYTLDMQD